MKKVKHCLCFFIEHFTFLFSSKVRLLEWRRLSLTKMYVQWRIKTYHIFRYQSVIGLSLLMHNEFTTSKFLITFVIFDNCSSLLANLLVTNNKNRHVNVTKTCDLFFDIFAHFSYFLVDILHSFLLYIIHRNMG